jgi:serine/threonine protein kinase
MKKNTVFETAFNKYKKGKQIGQGGSGTVFSVKDEDSVEYALKLLSPNDISTEKAKRFKNEINFCSNSNHPNIVKILDTGFYIDKEIKCPFYVMCLYEKTLREVIKTGIQHENILTMFSKILNGVEAAHLQEHWHRDLKPENILLNSNQDQIVIADFGIAHFNKETLLTLIETQPNARMANFNYAAPEQKKREAKVDHRADIFALGLILNEMFTGEIPYGEGYKKVVDVASQYSYFDDLVALMIHQSPDKRPNSIEEIKIQIKSRENDFISLQRIDKLKNEVVPIGKLGDESTFNPIELVNVDVDTEKELFILELNKNPNFKWIKLFRSIRDNDSLYYAFPEQVNIDRNKIN